MAFYNYLISKLQNIRYSVFPPKLLAFSAIYKMQYLNYKNDPNPLVWVQYSGPKYTHALNLNYMDSMDKAWFLRILSVLKRGNQAMDGLIFYRFLKLNRINIIKKCYRVYFTNQIKSPVLVSAGLTEMWDIVKPFGDSYISILNKTLQEKSSLFTQKVSPAFSQEELYSRVNEVFNSVPLEKQRSVSGVSQQGLAPWFQNAPWRR